ncbi:MAG: hypothetical protein J6X49_06480 [Victivallales bacterium]|nr:hypothetical protein [Victivallales bacterium]
MPMQPLASSFRDPCSHVCLHDGHYYRVFSQRGMADLKKFVESSLGEELLAAGKLVGYEIQRLDDISAIMELETIPFISYPYEWCFAQLRDAALLTLETTKAALRHGMILKDASAYNVAWKDGRPLFLDHGSFTIYEEGRPWQAYKQFIMHFLGPLMLCKYFDARLLSLLATHLDGIPLDLLSKMLPLSSRFSLCALLHIHWHTKMDSKHSQTFNRQATANAEISKKRLVELLNYLHGSILDMKPSHSSTEWENYYDETNYSAIAQEMKKQIIESHCTRLKPRRVIDLGANNGLYSQLAAQYANNVIAADIDCNAVEALYLKHNTKIYPLVQDFSNPSASCGVLCSERNSFIQRAHGDLSMGLALAHHLRIGGNWTLNQIAELFSSTGENSLVEFVPKEDSQVQKLLQSREDIYDDWRLETFIKTFNQRFKTCTVEPIADSARSMIFCSKD